MLLRTAHVCAAAAADWLHVHRQESSHALLYTFQMSQAQLLAEQHVTT